jgi:hypothetical protein
MFSQKTFEIKKNGQNSRLGEGTRAVSDRQRGGRSDGVSVSAMGDMGRARTVGGITGDDLSSSVVGSVSVSIGSGSNRGSERSKGNRKTHLGRFVCFNCVLRVLSSTVLKRGTTQSKRFGKTEFFE